MKPWTYEEDVFENVTANNYELMFKISEVHMNALIAGSAEPVIKTCAERYTPVYAKYPDLFTDWKQHGGNQHEQTLNTDQLLKLYKTKLDTWEPLITAVFLKGSNGYQGLFPQGRSAFANGSKDTRIAAFQTLYKAMEKTPELLTVLGLVKAYWQQLHDARDVQQQSKSTTGTGSSLLEAARIECAEVMFQNLGTIMSLYYKDRSRIGGYFALDLIRSHEQVIFKRQVKGGATVLIVKHTFAEGDEITLMNLGTNKLLFGLVATKNASLDEANAVVVEGGETKTVLATTIGAPENAYLMVKNTNAEIDGKCEVHFL